MKSTTLPGLLMGTLAVLCLILALLGLRQALQRTSWSPGRRKNIFWITTGVVAGWVILVGILAGSGWTAQFDQFPPRPLLVVFLPMVALLIIAFSKGFTTLLAAVPPHWLVLFQSFRIVVELLLWQGFLKGLVPVQMTFEGLNFDILAGVLALVAGGLMLRQKRAARTIGITYNIIGLALLLNIITIAILSMPTPMRYFMNKPANIIVATFPFIYLPAVVVVLAFGFHVFSLRQLLLKKSATLTEPMAERNGTNMAVQ